MENRILQTQWTTGFCGDNVTKDFAEIMEDMISGDNGRQDIRGDNGRQDITEIMEESILRR